MIIYYKHLLYFKINIAIWDYFILAYEVCR